MSAYGRNFSTRLFIQAAFTGLLAPAGSRSSTWLMVTFAVAAGAAVVAAVVRSGHDRTRELVIGFEAVAVAVGGVGLAGGHYIPGTIIGIAALITAINHPMATAVPVPAQPGLEPAGAFAPPQFAAPQFPAPQFPAPQFPAPQVAAPEVPAPQYAPPAAPVSAEPAATLPVAPPQAPLPGVRAMNILPGQ